MKRYAFAALAALCILFACAKDRVVECKALNAHARAPKEFAPVSEDDLAAFREAALRMQKDAALRVFPECVFKSEGGYLVFAALIPQADANAYAAVNAYTETILRNAENEIFYEARSTNEWYSIVEIAFSIDEETAGYKAIVFDATGRAGMFDYIGMMPIDIDVLHMITESIVPLQTP